MTRLTQSSNALRHIRIAKKFNRLVPYNPKFVREILKIQDVNHVDRDTKKPLCRLMAYAIAAKRYALYTRCTLNT